MNSKERVMAAIEFRQPDRLPIWDSYWGGFVEEWRQYKGLVGQETTPTDYYGIDIAICEADACFFPSERKLISKDSEYTISQDGWGRTVRQGKQNSYFMETLDSVLQTPSDLANLAFEPASLESRYGDVIKDVAVQRRAGRCVFAKVGGIYVRSHFLRGEDKLLLDMALDEEFCDLLFDRVVDHLTQMALHTLQVTDAWDTGLWVYDDMANIASTMFSPSMFERYFLDRYRKMISQCRNEGCRHFFFHSDGNVAPVLDMLLEAGFEGFHPMEPRCGLRLQDLRRRYGKRAVFLGGMCNTVILPRGDKKEIEEHVMPLIEMGKEGGLILGSASIGQDVSPETYDYYMGLLKQHATTRL